MKFALMQKIYIGLFFMLLFLGSSCQKAEDETKVNTNSYKLHNVEDYYVNPEEETELVIPLTITDSLNNGEAIFVKIEKLPDGVTASSQSIVTNSNDTFFLYLRANMKKKAIHPMKISCSSTSGNIQYFWLNIVVQDECKASLNGNWNAFDSGETSFFPSHYAAYVSASSNYNEVGFELMNRVINGHLTCGNGKITLDPCFDMIKTSEGTGTFTSNRIVLKYQIYSFSNISVTTILTR